MGRHSWIEYKDRLCSGPTEALANFIEPRGSVAYEELLPFYVSLGTGGETWTDEMYRTALDSELIIMDNYSAIDWDYDSGTVVWNGK